MNNLSKFGLPSGMGGFQNNQANRGGYEAPTDFVELPSQGKFYPKSSPLYGLEKVEVKFMTAREEDLLVSPGLQKAGLAIDRAIESLLMDKRIRAKDLLIGDKNAILLNARKNAFGDNYEFSYACGKCGEINQHTEDFNNLKIKEIKQTEACTISENGMLTMRLPKSGVVLELKFLRGEDETAIEQIIEKKAKNNLPVEALLTRYRFMIVSVNGNTDTEEIVAFISSMPIMDSSFLRKRYGEMNPDVLFTYSAECKSCKHTTEGGVPIMANFFWPEL